MNTERLIESWFRHWEDGNYHLLPIAENFKHTSPFGTIDGKSTYLNLVEHNKEKFLGYKFQVHDSIFLDGKACVRYTARQGDNFELNVSEWYYINGDLIEEIVAYYHIGEIRDERKLDGVEP